MRGNLIERALFCVGLLAMVAFLGAPSCPQVDKNGQIIETDSEDVGFSQGEAVIDGDVDPSRTYDMTAKSGAEGAFGFNRLNLQMNTYDVQGICGLPNYGNDWGNFNGGTGFYGCEMNVPGTDPLEFHGLYAQPLAGGAGIRVFQADNLNGTGNFVDFNGANFVELMISNNGTSVLFSARPTNQPNFTQVEFIQNAPPGPWVPGMGVFNFDDGATVSFTQIQILPNDLPVFGDPFEQITQDVLLGTLLPQVMALNDIADGFDEQPNSYEMVRQELLNSANGLSAPLATIEATVPQDKAEEKARKKGSKAIVKLDSKIEKAAEKLAKQPSPDKLQKAVLKLIADTIKTNAKITPKRK